MKRCLADVNVLLALLVRHHEHHKLAGEWFDNLAAGGNGPLEEVTVRVSLYGPLQSIPAQGRSSRKSLLRRGRRFVWTYPARRRKRATPA